MPLPCGFLYITTAAQSLPPPPPPLPRPDDCTCLCVAEDACLLPCLAPWHCLCPIGLLIGLPAGPSHRIVVIIRDGRTDVEGIVHRTGRQAGSGAGASRWVRDTAMSFSRHDVPCVLRSVLQTLGFPLEPLLLGLPAGDSMVAMGDVGGGGGSGGMVRQ